MTRAVRRLARQLALARERDVLVFIAPYDRTEAVREPRLPRQVIRTGVHPDQDVTRPDIAVELDPRERVVSHAGGSADGREPACATAVVDAQHAMWPVVGSQRVIRAASITDRVAALGSLLHVEHTHGENRGFLGEKTTVLEPHLLERRPTPGADAID